MEIIKQNETFVLSETTDMFTSNGSIVRDSNGSLNIHLTLNKVDGEYLGDGYYNKYAERDAVSFSLNCSEKNLNEFTEFAKAVVNSVLEYFESYN